MKDIKFPVDFVFNISTFANDFTATDANGQTMAYVRQKMFKLKEAIKVYNDQTKSQVNFTINADRWLDFSAAYTFADADGNTLGKVVRKGWKSIWKAEYQIIDKNEQQAYSIREENGWVKVLDSLLGEVPVLGIFTGYLFNPSYIVTDNNGKEIIRLKKQASFFGRRFQVTRVEQGGENDEVNIMLGLMMMILLERRRG